jgi:hypothetical protein
MDRAAQDTARGFQTRISRRRALQLGGSAGAAALAGTPGFALLSHIHDAGDDAPWVFLYENPEVNAINRKLQWAGGRRDEYPIFAGASIQA